MFCFVERNCKPLESLVTSCGFLLFPLCSQTVMTDKSDSCGAPSLPFPAFASTWQKALLNTYTHMCLYVCICKAYGTHHMLATKKKRGGNGNPSPDKALSERGSHYQSPSRSPPVSLIPRENICYRDCIFFIYLRHTRTRIACGTR